MTDFLGTQGDDTLTGTAGDDVILAGAGSDTVDGGDGDDVITDGDLYPAAGWSEFRGFETLLRGGAGNDRITAYYSSAGATNFGNQRQTVRIEGGTGNDYVQTGLSGPGSLTIDLGAGDDVLRLTGGGMVTLGAGRDRVILNDTFLSEVLGQTNLVITDMTAGDAGDILDLSAIVATYFDLPNPQNGTITANPFASGHLRLIQDGADVLVRLDVDGNASGTGAAYERDIVRLVGVTASQLTAANFAGWAPNGAAPVAVSLTGTTGNDVLIAGPTGGTVLGLAGNDELIGGRLADRLEGGDGNDLIDGGQGSDTLLGGAGNDTIRDAYGSDTVDGGDGDDTIELTRGVWSRDNVRFGPEVLAVAAGNGNDVVVLGRSLRQSSADVLAPLIATIDLGAGNDRFTSTHEFANVTVTLGAGRDVVDYRLTGLTITDFQVGPAGDAIDLGYIIALFETVPAGANPFATGHVRLVQAGADTLVIADYDGIGGGSFIDGLTNEAGLALRLQNVNVADLVAANFMGFDPRGAAPGAASQNGTAAADVLSGGNSNDTIDGGDGDDRISGADGNDTLTGGNGNDTIEGGRGNDVLNGGIGNDVLSDTGSGADSLLGGDGDDRITVAHTYFTTNDTITVDAGAGNDWVSVGASSGSGNQAAITANLGAGNDTYVVADYAAGGTVLTLGTGSDTVVVPLTLASTGARQNGLGLAITDFQTGAGGDRLDWVSYALEMTYDGSFVRRTIEEMSYRTGFVSDGRLDGFNPFAIGSARLVQSGADTLLQVATFPNNTPGYSEQAFTDFTTVMVFRNTAASSFTAFNLGFDPSYVTHAGTVNADTVTGTANRDVMDGGAGNDQLTGAAGDDVLRGGQGNDTLDGGIGNDLVFGGFGADTVNGGDGDDIIDGGSGFDMVSGGAGNDLISDMEGGDNISGGSGNDIITVEVTTAATPGSGQQGNVIDAGDGDDVVNIRINPYNNPVQPQYSVNLGAGNDIYSGAVTQLSSGRLGTLTLGAGSDRVYTFSGTITDFQTGTGGDSFDLASLILALSNELAAPRISLVRVGQDPFANGFAALRQNGSSVELDLDLYGTGHFAGSGAGVVTFQNTTLANFTAANFAGFNPAGRGVLPVLINQSTTVAAGQTLTIGNTLPSFNGGDAAITYNDQTGAAVFVNNGVVNIARTDGIDFAGFRAPNAAGLTPGPQSIFTNAATGEFVVSETYAPAGGQAVIDAVDPWFTVTGYSYARSSPGGTADLITNAGRFAVSTNVGTAYGVNGGATVNNTGTFTVTSGYDAVGFRSGLVTNSGNITVSAAEFAVGFFGAPLHNLSGGSITVITDPASPYASIGVLIRSSGALFPDLPPTEYLVNAGTLTADIAYYSQEFRGTPYGLNELITNSGTINGLLFMERGDDRIVNTGTISGRIILGQGNDRYEGGSGVHSGSIEGGAGNDVLIGGAAAESLFGDADSDVISAGGGDDFVEGGSGNDILDGGSGWNTLSYVDSTFGITADLATGTVTTAASTDFVRNFSAVVGSRGQDSISGTASDETFIGQAGNDTLDGRGGNDTLWGGRGTDVLTGGAGKDRFIFELGDGGDTITDFAGADTIEIFGYTGYQSMVQQGADVLITLSATDSILVRNTTLASMTSATLMFSSGGTGIAVPVLTDDTVHVTANTAIAAGTLFDIRDSQPMILRDVTQPEVAGFAIDGALGTPGAALWNSGTIRYVSSVAGLPVNGVTNSIENPYNGREHSFINQLTGRVEVTADQASELIAVGGVVHVWNDGTIIANSANGAVWGVRDMGGYVAGTAFVNSGSIQVTAGGTAVGVGHAASTTSGADLYLNSGSVIAAGAGGSAGYQLHFTAHPAAAQPVMVNTGTITVTDNTAAIDSSGIYVQIGSHARIWNSGTITADYAVRAVSGTTVIDPAVYSLTLYNTGTLNGRVQGSLYHDTIINTHVINGDVFLGNGDDLFDGRAGQQTGTIDGYDGDDRIYAGAGTQQLIGGFGNDVLSGGAGADVLTGGFGRDAFRYETGFGADVITDFQTGAEHDYIDIAGYSAYQSMVQQGSDVLITFAAGETLLLRGVQLAAITPAMLRFGAAAIAANSVPDAPTAPAAPVAPDGATVGAIDLNLTFLPVTGTPGADVLTGAAGPDDLIGLAGNDTLDGGTGNDLLRGGLGDDLYLADSGLDIVFENVGEGTDTVRATAGYYLYANIENLTLASGAGSIFGVGNELANILTGNEGDNLLIAGDGDDTIDGGLGHDALFGEAGNDVLNGQAGIDYLVAGLGNDRLDGGDNADALYGQEGDDVLIGGVSFDTDIMVGGDGNDTFYGNSGLGDYDLLYGNQGDDLFYVDTFADLVFEQAGEGVDTVIAGIEGTGYYLYENIENLILTGNTPFGVGNGLDNRLTGNAIGNYLLGGAGNDTLNGMAGDDVLFGEAGADVFVFTSGTGGDVIGDFQLGSDRIDVSAFGFTFADLQARFVQNGSHGAINLGNGDFIVIHSVTMSQLTAADFILSAGAEPPAKAPPVMELPDQGAADAAGFDLAGELVTGLIDDGLQRWLPEYGHHLA